MSDFLRNGSYESWYTNEDASKLIGFKVFMVTKAAVVASTLIRVNEFLENIHGNWDTISLECCKLVSGELEQIERQVSHSELSGSLEIVACHVTSMDRSPLYVELTMTSYKLPNASVTVAMDQKATIQGVQVSFH